MCSREGALERDRDDGPDQRDVDIRSAARDAGRGQRRAELCLHVGGGDRRKVDGIARGCRASGSGELQCELAVGGIQDAHRLLLVLGGEALGLDGQAGYIDAGESDPGEPDQVGATCPHHGHAEKRDVGQEVQRCLDLKSSGADVDVGRGQVLAVEVESELEGATVGAGDRDLLDLVPEADGGTVDVHLRHVPAAQAVLESDQIEVARRHSRDGDLDRVREAA